MKNVSNLPVGEASFIAELEKKAKEQHKLASTQMIPEWARGLGVWLAVNPWRVIVPLSVVVYGVLRIAFGSNYREFILGLFGGFVR